MIAENPQALFRYERRESRLSILQSNQRHLEEEDIMTIRDHVNLEQDIIDSTDVIIRAPVIYSWGRNDTNTLLQSPNDILSTNGVNTLAFANKRTIIQVEMKIKV